MEKIITGLELKFRVFNRIHRTMHVVGTDRHDAFHIWDDNQVSYYNYQTGEPSITPDMDASEDDGSGYILLRYSGKKDICGTEVFEGDIIESHTPDGKILAINMVVRYGTYRAWCPVDSEYVDSVGFYVSATGYPDMPIGSLEQYAKVIGNIYENPEIFDFCDN